MEHTFRIIHQQTFSSHIHRLQSCRKVSQYLISFTIVIQLRASLECAPAYHCRQSASFAIQKRPAWPSITGWKASERVISGVARQPHRTVLSASAGPGGGRQGEGASGAVTAPGPHSALGRRFVWAGDLLEAAMSGQRGAGRGGPPASAAAYQVM